MEKKITVDQEDGNDVHFGLPFMKGPKTMRVLVTWPYDQAGEIVEIPCKEVTSMATVKPEKLGIAPKVVDT